jgi:CRP-like cAMP-binding protein
MKPEQILYSGLSAKQMGAMRHCGNYLEIPAGGLIFEEGDRTDSFYVVLKGDVQAFRRRGETEKAIGIIAAGDVLGLAGMVEYQQMVSARAATNATLFQINVNPLRLAKNLGDPKAAVQLLENTMRIVAEYILRIAKQKKGAQAPASVFTNDLIAIETIEKSTPFSLFGKKKKLKPEGYLFRAGETPKGFYYIYSGTLEYSIEDDSGETTILGAVSGPAIAGEFAFFAGYDYHASLQARDDVQYAIFPKTEYSKLKKKDPDKAARIVVEATRHAIEGAAGMLFPERDAPKAK